MSNPPGDLRVGGEDCPEPGDGKVRSNVGNGGTSGYPVPPPVK